MGRAVCGSVASQLELVASVLDQLLDHCCGGGWRLRGCPLWRLQLGTQRARVVLEDPNAGNLVVIVEGTAELPAPLDTFTSATEK